VRRYALPHSIIVVERLAPPCLAALSLSIASSPAVAQCRASTLQFPSLGPLPTSQQSFDVTSPDNSWIRGDHRTGAYSLHHSGHLAPTDVVARDPFDVTDANAAIVSCNGFGPRPVPVRRRSWGEVKAIYR
jgi:hypothetical protein